MKKIILLGLSLNILCLPSLFAQESIQKSKVPSSKESKTSKGNEGGKAQGFMGDPAQKRGFELGYDAGVRAGKEDKKLNHKSAPQSREEYKNADKQYRYEYGVRARFVGGYQSGFSKGYQAGYSREKVDTEAAKQDKESLKTAETQKKGSESKSVHSSSEAQVATTLPAKKTETTKPKVEKFNPADDAL